MATQKRSTHDQQNQQPQRDQQDEPQRGTDGGTQDSARDGATDRGGTGGYGASSGFSEETRSGRDQYGEGDQQDRDIDIDSDLNRDVGMRGRDTGRTDDDSMR